MRPQRCAFWMGEASSRTTPKLSCRNLRLTALWLAAQVSIPDHSRRSSSGSVVILCDVFELDERLALAFQSFSRSIEAVIPCMTTTAGVKGQKQTRVRLSAVTRQRAGGDVAAGQRAQSQSLSLYKKGFAFAFFCLRS